MSTPFSHFFTKINQISPLESNFTEVLEAIALKPKTLYFRGKMPENVSKGPSQKPEQQDPKRSLLLAQGIIPSMARKSLIN